MACGGVDHNAARLGQRLQPRGAVRRIADRGLFARLAGVDPVADHHEPGGDPDANAQAFALDGRGGHGLGRGKRGMDRLLRVRLARLRPAEIDQHAVANVAGNEAAEPRDRPGNTALVAADQRAEVFRVEPRRELRRADQIAEHNAEMAALGR